LPAAAGVGPALPDEIAKTNKGLAEVRGKVGPTRDALEQYRLQQLQLDDLLGRGKIKLEEHNRLQGLSKDALRETLLGGLDPLIEANTVYERQLESIKAAQQAGLITQEQVVELNERARLSLEATVLTQKEFLDSLEGGQAGIVAFHVALTEFSAGVRTPFEQLHSGFTAVFSELQSSIDQFVETGKFSFRDFASSVLKELQKIALKALLVQAITAATKGTSFGASGVGAAIAQAAGGTGRAAGGPVTAGQPFKVGESGTELFVPPRRGRIVSNSELSGLGGRQQVVQNFTINTPDADSFRRSESQILKGANRNLRRAETRR